MESLIKRTRSLEELAKVFVQNILTNTLFHPHGTKVRLISGEVGRVQIIL
ncbi:MAG: DUF2196 domain-containing protein [Bacteroidota bacterium]